MPAVQLTLEAAAVARADGMQRAEAHAALDWKAEAFSALRAYLATHETFFCDDLWTTGLSRPAESRALGPVIARAARERLMERTGEFRKSVASHLSEKPLWRSLVYAGAALDLVGGGR
jgi:hypothetical protein